MKPFYCTSSTDKNYLSFSEDTVQLHLGTSIAEEILEPYPKELLPLFPEDWNSILKISSNNQAISLEDICVSQGVDSSVDCDEASYINICGNFGLGKEKPNQILNIKGGSNSVIISGTIHSRGRVADVVVGSWSDKSYEKSCYLDFTNLVRADGEPVTFILARCDRDSVQLPKHAKVFRLKSFIYNFYWYVKYLYLTAVYQWFINKR